MAETFWKGNEIWGKIKILNTPSGNIIKNLIKEGVNIGISSRALGSVKEENGRTIVEDDLQLICWDFVGDPSTHGAFVHLMEAKKIDKKETSKENKLRQILFDIVGAE